MEENGGNQTQPTSVNQTSQGVQTSPTPNVAQPLIQPIQPSFQQSATSQQPEVIQSSGGDEIKSGKRTILMILIGLIVLMALVVVGVTVFYKYYKLIYVDKTYGFIIKDQRGWYSVPKKEGVYYSIGTAVGDSDSVISYFGVSPIKHTVDGLDESLVEQVVKDSCNQTEEDVGSKVISFSETTLNDLRGYLCVTEGEPAYVNKTYIQKYYALINKPNSSYDYILTITYPKDNSEEEMKAEKIINNFYAR